MNVQTGAFAIRDLTTLEDLEACVALQQEVWGERFSQLAPVSILKVSQRLGGVVAGAFDGAGDLAGFVFGLTGIEDEDPVHWSDMLAVRSGLRGAGLGRRLKAWQRSRCLERGVRRAYWTFDPLESRNAWLNLGRLGAVARDYLSDMYGASDSPLHQGLGTDRLLALWLMDSPRVEERLGGRGDPPPTEEILERLPRAFEVEVDGRLPRPITRDATPDPGSTTAAALLVPIPADIQGLKAARPDLAVSWREAIRSALAPRLADGWEVRELVRSPEPVSYYVLQRSEART